jgi:hypothetical protein
MDQTAKKYSYLIEIEVKQATSDQAERLIKEINSVTGMKAKLKPQPIANAKA